MARYIGTNSDFHKFIGPRVRNIIQTLTKSGREKKVCEFCGKKGDLQSAHKNGKERKFLIDEVLRKYDNGHFLEIDDLDKCENSILELHKPIHEIFHFICRDCHKKYDNKNCEAGNRKKQVLDILQSGPTSIKELAETINVTQRNISSILTGLKKDGHIIHTDEKKRKYLVTSTKEITG